MRHPYSFSTAPYAPSALEQKALEYLVKEKYGPANQWYDRAVIDDPSRFRRIQSQWAGQTGRRTVYLEAECALQLNKKDEFCKAFEWICERQGVSCPEDTDALFRQASQPYQNFPAYHNPPDYRSIEIPRVGAGGVSMRDKNPPGKSYAEGRTS